MHSEISMINNNTEEYELNYWNVRRNIGIRIGGYDFLSLQGAESIDFLNRLSTNDLSTLSLNSCRYTVLLTEKGKIVDLVLVIRRDKDVLLLVSQRNGFTVKNWLEKFIIMEDVLIRNCSNELEAIQIYIAESKLHINSALPFQFEVHKDRCLPIESGFGKMLLFSDPLWKGCKNVLIGNKREALLLFNSLHSNTHSSIIYTIYPANFELIQIEEAIPLISKELTMEINPLEACLNDFISFTKGCYIGQEVISRIDTYKKLQQKIVGFVFLDNKINLPQTNYKIINNNKEYGSITSIAWSYS